VEAAGIVEVAIADAGARAVQAPAVRVLRRLRLCLLLRKRREWRLRLRRLPRKFSAGALRAAVAYGQFEWKRKLDLQSHWRGQWHTNGEQAVELRLIEC
jgi:hypothetical protein